MMQNKHILVHNIYYMLSYAFQALNRSDDEDMAPETFVMMQNEEGTIDRAIDVFALGIVFQNLAASIGGIMAGLVPVQLQEKQVFRSSGSAVLTLLKCSWVWEQAVSVICSVPHAKRHRASSSLTS